jgi:hemolysin III
LQTYPTFKGRTQGTADELACPHDPISAWTHGLWMLASLPAGAVLVWKNRGDAGRLIGMAAFAVSLVVCFGSSGFYHAAPEGPLRNALHLLDYLGIYLLIAGSATPIAVVVLRGWWRRWLLAQLWALALAGGVLRATVPLPQAFWTGLFLAMGWIGVVTYFELARRLSHRLLRPLWLGGILYSAGAAINLAGWPDLWPGVVGLHELFHLFVTPYRQAAAPARTAVDTSPAGGARPDPVRISQGS